MKLQDTWAQRVWFPGGTVKASAPDHYFFTCRDHSDLCQVQMDMGRIVNPDEWLGFGFVCRYDALLVNWWVSSSHYYDTLSSTHGVAVYNEWESNPSLSTSTATKKVPDYLPGPEWKSEARGTSGFEFL